MEQYKVEITKEALQDMEDMYNYIALELLSPENAMGQYNQKKLMVIYLTVGSQIHITVHITSEIYIID